MSIFLLELLNFDNVWCTEDVGNVNALVAERWEEHTGS